ncbi:hypothetical protein ACFX2I_039895 [Malus domestica]
MDMDLALRTEEPPMPNEGCTSSQRSKHEKWEKSNRICLMIIKRSMTDVVRGGFPDATNAKQFMKSIEEKYKESEKTETGNLMNSLTTIKYDGEGSVREYILKVIEIAGKLRTLEVPISETFLVHVIMNSLPSSYTQLKVSYNALQAKWDVNELISICVGEEVRIKKEKAEKEKGESVNFVQGYAKSANNYNSDTAKRNFARNIPPSKKTFKVNNSSVFKCYFCKKTGHMKRNCPKYKSWLAKQEAKKGKNKTSNVFACFESNLIDTPSNAWWLDSGSSIHVTNSLQDCITKRTPNKDEVKVSVGNGRRVEVKALGTVRLKLDFGFCLELENVVYVPSMRRKLVSVSKLVLLGFYFTLNNIGFNVFYKSSHIGTGFLCDGMFKFKTNLIESVFNVEKEVKNSKNSSNLWHRRLGHISKQRMELLVKNDILPPLNFNDFDFCIECVKGKMVNKRKEGSTRSKQLLEIIHTDICGPFPTQTIEGNKYFITFIDDYSRYCYIYLIPEKSKALEVFKIYKTEVENQLEKKIKIVRSDRGGEYYGRYIQNGRHPGPFALFLQDNGIVAQYTTLGTPEQNGVAERRNRTLMDMVRSMICRVHLPKYLWGDAVKTANYLLNRVPSKAVENTPFELWTGRRPSLNHLHVWGCKAEAKIYNPSSVKLDPKTISCYFIGYAERSKGFRFYCSSNQGPKIVETQKAIFMEYNLDDDSGTNDNDFVFDDERDTGISIEHAKTSYLEAPTMASDFSSHMHNDTDASEFSNHMHNDTYAIEFPMHMHDDTNEVEGNMTSEQGNNVGAIPPIDNTNGVNEPMDTEALDMQTQQGQEGGIVENQPMALRKSTRVRKSTTLADFVYMTEASENDIDLSEFDDPKTFKEAITSSNSKKWLEAMHSELTSMKENGVWELVEQTDAIKPNGCKWVFKTKRDSNGNIERHKARLIAKGFTQREGVDYKETFSPVSTKDAFRVVMAIVAHFDLALHQMDVKTAFLNGDLEEDIYMKQPEGFEVKGREKLVYKLKKSIYGLKQASRQWYLKFQKVMKEQGFTENPSDTCIYLKVSGSSFILLVIYVDDILLATNDTSLLDEIKTLLQQNFEMKDLREASYVLGIEIKRDRKKGLLGLSQKGYIEKVLKRFNMFSCGTTKMPISKGDKLSKAQCPKNDLERKIMEEKPYASLVGSLMYAQVCTRPDFAFTISVLGRFQANVGEAHWNAAKRVLRYLQRTKEHMLIYGRTYTLVLEGYSDSDFAGCIDDLKSTSGFVFTMAGGAVSWRTMKQATVAASTMVAEYLSCCEAVDQAIWLKNFITGLRVVDSIARPIQLFCDNNAAIFFTKNNKRSSATRNLDIKYLIAREKVMARLVKIDYLETGSMIADPLNKAVPVMVFKKHIAKMGVLSGFDAVV